MRLTAVIVVLVVCISELLAEPLRRLNIEDDYDQPMALVKRARVRELLGKRDNGWSSYPGVKRTRELFGKRAGFPAKRRGRELFGKRSDTSFSESEGPYGDDISDHIFDVMQSARRVRRARELLG